MGIVGEKYDRFRSFAERYVIERAATFTKGKEQEEAWAATLDARSIYRGIERASHDAEPDVQDAAQQASVGSSGATGATGPMNHKYGGLTPQEYHKAMMTLNPPLFAVDPGKVTDETVMAIRKHEGWLAGKLTQAFSPNRKGAK